MNRKTQSVDTLRISTARNHISSTPILKDLKISRIKGLIAPGTRIKKRRNTKIESIQRRSINGNSKMEKDIGNVKTNEKRSQFFSKRLSARRVEDNNDYKLNTMSSLSIKNVVSCNNLHPVKWLRRSSNKHNEIVKQIKESFKSLCPSASISQLTSTYNERISNELNRLNIKSEQIHTNKIYSMKTDCRDLLKTASKEIKRVSYQLSTLVTDGEQHVQLFNGSVQDLELLDSFPKYCKIFCK